MDQSTKEQVISFPMDDMSVTICKVEFWPVDVPITDPFVVATGARTIAENVFLRITLADGAQGYGEAAPFPEVGGETRESCLIALHQLGKAVLGRSAADYKEVGHLLSEQALTHPAARCGLETAVFDAYCRASNIPMWQLWGGADVRARETDITIPITDLDKTVALARG
jgi:L-alanine-DL-glutamate epimerase-like enolase superfamily enzyme